MKIIAVCIVFFSLSGFSKEKSRTDGDGFIVDNVGRNIKCRSGRIGIDDDYIEISIKNDWREELFDGSVEIKIFNNKATKTILLEKSHLTSHCVGTSMRIIHTAYSNRVHRKCVDEIGCPEFIRNRFGTIYQDYFDPKNRDDSIFNKYDHYFQIDSSTKGVKMDLKFLTDEETSSQSKRLAKNNVIGLIDKGKISIENRVYTLDQTLYLCSSF